ncbi:DUF3800 domain-containing protein [Streptomyces venezuelae]|uniref:DUF3800 domain-containing protein n=1 Tax=Streptomyces venezuelae TaxID=54571 RepID=UPI001CC229CB|nr:DUF3800 domain-containing protein [Streptomyces venezuelae]
MDDSGIPNTFASFTAIAAEPAAWHAFDRAWAELRLTWFHDYGVPVEYELHASPFLGGRGRPGARNPTKADRRRMAQSALDLIGGSPGLAVRSVYSVHRDFRAAKQLAFTGLVREVDSRLAQDGQTAGLVIDGDGTDRLYDQVYDELQPTGIVRPVLQVPAHESVPLQAADLVAWTACQVIAGDRGQDYARHWHQRHLPKAALPREA